MYPIISLNRNETIIITNQGNKNVYFLTNQKLRFAITCHAKVNVSKVMTSHPFDVIFPQCTCIRVAEDNLLVVEREPVRFEVIMPHSSNVSTAFFLLIICLIQLCLLQGSLGESPPAGELKYTRLNAVVSSKEFNITRSRRSICSIWLFCNNLTGLDTLQRGIL